MANVTYDTLVPDIALEVPGAPEPVIISELRKVVIDFCERTKAWQHDIAAFNVAKDTAVLSLTPPDETRIVEIIKPSWAPSGRRIHPRSEAQLNVERSGWESEVGSEALFYFVPGINKLRIVPMLSEDVASAISVKVALVPTRASTGFSSEIDEQYRDYLVAGAKARLQLLPDKEWTNVQQAAINSSHYESGVSAAQIRALKSGTRAPQLAEPVEFGAS